jgi:hypothetical protein
LDGLYIISNEFRNSLEAQLKFDYPQMRFAREVRRPLEAMIQTIRPDWHLEVADAIDPSVNLLFNVLDQKREPIHRLVVSAENCLALL